MTPSTDFNLETIREALSMFAKMRPVDEIELIVRDVGDFPMHARIRFAGVTVVLSEYMPPGIVIAINRTRERALTMLSTDAEVAACLTIYDWRDKTP